MRVISGLFILAVSFKAFAENSALSFIYQQASNGRACGQLTSQEATSVGNSCTLRSQKMLETQAPRAVFDWSVFQIAARNQVLKNNCISQQINALLKDNEIIDAWYSHLVARWLGLRKAQLIVYHCDLAAKSPGILRDLTRFGGQRAKNAAQKANPQLGQPVAEAWKKTCEDEEQLASLRQAPMLFQSSLPVISGPEMFQLMESHRDGIINKKTGKPLTDDELLNSDLQDLSFSRFSFTEKFEDKVRSKLSDLANQRKSMSDHLDKTKTENEFNLSPEQQDYIFEDETLVQTLKSEKLLTSPEHPSELNLGAFCLLARFQPSLGGELTDMTVKTALFGSGTMKLFEGAGALRSMTKLQRLKTAATYGAVETGMLSVTQALAKACPVGIVDEEVRNARKVVSRDQNKRTSMVLQGFSLPDHLGYLKKKSKSEYSQLPDLKFKPEDIPACVNEDHKTLVYNSTYDTNCLYEGVMSLAPLQIALPAMAIGH